MRRINDVMKAMINTKIARRKSVMTTGAHR